MHDPYFQHFTGEEFFQHEFPHERSDLSHWRKRLGNKLELRLAESLRVGARQQRAADPGPGARSRWTPRCSPKNITFPTDCQAAARGDQGAQPPGAEAPGPTAAIASSVSPRRAMMAGRCAHAKRRFNRRRRQLRPAHPAWTAGPTTSAVRSCGRQDIEAAFEARSLAPARSARSNSCQRGWKLYSFHAPETECIGKGKASAPYEFGVKASIAFMTRSELNPAC